MEEETIKSRFCDIPRNELKNSDELFYYDKGVHSFKVGREERLFDTVISKLYNQLDYLSSRKSCFSFDELTRKLEPLLNITEFLKQNGIVKSLGFDDDRYNDTPAFYKFHLEPEYPPYHTDGREIRKGIGFGFWNDPITALSKAIGEFLERYSLLIYKKKELLNASAGQLKRKKIPYCDIYGLAGFSREQKNRHPSRFWDEESLFSWIGAARVRNGEKIYLPAQLVFWNYQLDSQINEPFLREANTNGCGGFYSREGAVLSSLYELIERDAFLIHWLNSISPPKVEPSTIQDANFQNLLQQSLRYGFKIHCLYLTLDIPVPIFAVVIEDPSDIGPKFSLGASCGVPPEKAALSAFMEAWSVYHSNRRKDRTFSLPDSYNAFSDAAVGRDERLLLWSNPDMAKHFSFFLTGNMKKADECSMPHFTFNSKREELDYITRSVEALGRGYEVYAYFPVHKILDDTSFHSARAVVPKLVPLYLMEINAPLGSERIQSVSNQWPHPFP